MNWWCARGCTDFVADDGIEPPQELSGEVPHSQPREHYLTWFIPQLPFLAQEFPVSP